MTAAAGSHAVTPTAKYAISRRFTYFFTIRTPMPSRAAFRRPPASPAIAVDFVYFAFHDGASSITITGLNELEDLSYRQCHDGATFISAVSSANSGLRQRRLDQ